MPWTTGAFSGIDRLLLAYQKVAPSPTHEEEGARTNPLTETTRLCVVRVGLVRHSPNHAECNHGGFANRDRCRCCACIGCRLAGETLIPAALFFQAVACGAAAGRPPAAAPRLPSFRSGGLFCSEPCFSEPGPREARSSEPRSNEPGPREPCSNKPCSSRLCFTGLGFAAAFSPDRPRARHRSVFYLLLRTWCGVGTAAVWRLRLRSCSEAMRSRP